VADTLAGRDGLLVTVNHGRRELRLYECARGEAWVIRRYSVAVGRCDSRTPCGTFRVETMLEDPVWNVPDDPRAYGSLAGTRVPPGSPHNRIAARWLGFHGSIGIHGTHPRRLGLGASDGCVLMTVPDVIDLYAAVAPGTPLVVS
jgi:lipoprotein-anchoring transpeptidase ErfK/SrfK